MSRLIPRGKPQIWIQQVTPSSPSPVCCLTVVAGELESFRSQWPQKIHARSPPFAPSDELESPPAQPPPPLVHPLSPPLSDGSSLSLAEATGLTYPAFLVSFPFSQTVVPELSLKQLACICLSGRQKCRNTVYHNLITITPIPGKEDLSSISYRSTLLHGVRLRRVECTPPPPGQGFRKMCSFACQSFCHLTNTKGFIRHQKPHRGTPHSGSCPNLPRLFICGTREEFCRKQDLIALGGLEICYRENRNDGYDPAKTQLFTIGQSLLAFALNDLSMEDDEEMRIWRKIEAGK
jgi:hypothetical protein